MVLYTFEIVFTVYILLVLLLGLRLYVLKLIDENFVKLSDTYVH